MNTPKSSMPRPLQLPIHTRSTDLNQPPQTFRESLYTTHPEKTKDFQAIYAASFRFRQPLVSTQS
jgi:hypothetical protein